VYAVYRPPLSEVKSRRAGVLRPPLAPHEIGLSRPYFTYKVSAGQPPFTPHLQGKCCGNLVRGPLDYWPAAVGGDYFLSFASPTSLPDLVVSFFLSLQEKMPDNFNIRQDPPRELLVSDVVI